jgi:hypothetical protein
MNVPTGRRRKYHDDVTVIVIILGTNQRTPKASICILVFKNAIFHLAVMYVWWFLPDRCNPQTDSF